MTPEEYYEFMTLIRNLRFKGIDTKPEDVENKYIRMAWRAVRPSVLKSTRNARAYENKKNKKQEQEQEPLLTTYDGTPLPPPSQEAATYYPPVPDDEARDFPTEDDKEEWYATLIPDGYPNRKDKFNKEWSYYFTSRTEAAKEAEAYLAKNKIHISLM